MKNSVYMESSISEKDHVVSLVDFQSGQFLQINCYPFKIENFCTNCFEIPWFRYFSNHPATAKDLLVSLEDISPEMPGLSPVSRLIMQPNANECSYFLGCFEGNGFCGGHGSCIPVGFLLLEGFPLLLRWHDSAFTSPKSHFSTSQIKIKISGSYLHAQLLHPRPSVKSLLRQS